MHSLLHTRFRLQWGAAILCHLLLGIAVLADEPTSDAKVYEEFRSWVTQQSPDAEGKPLERYRAVLAGKGLTEDEIERQITILVERREHLEVERWNRILTSPTPRFNIEPNAFLAAMVEDLTPGTALDVGMGQGRNAIYLASRGWQVTGFDPAEKAVAMAEEQARELDLEIETYVQRDDEFDFGTDRWDLIVLSYVRLRELLPELHRSLKPDGRVVIEAFHHDATKGRSIGGGVVFESNELLRLFESFRILHYEDVEARADFGQRQTRLVRLCAQKE